MKILLTLMALCGLVLAQDKECKTYKDMIEGCILKQGTARGETTYTYKNGKLVAQDGEPIKQGGGWEFYR